MKKSVICAALAVLLTSATLSLAQVTPTGGIGAGGSGGAVTAVLGAFVDGWDVTFGAKADSATCAPGNTGMACWRQIDADIKGTGNVQGAAASGATDTDVPLNNGARAAGAAVSPVADGQKVAAEADLEGRMITSPYAVKEQMLRGAASATTTSATTIIAAQGAGIKIYITAIQCFREDAGTTPIHATLNDSASTPIPVPAGAGSAPPFPTPLVVAANTALQFTMSSAVTTAYCNAQGYKGP